MGLGDDSYLLTHLAYTWALMGQLEQVERLWHYMALAPSDSLGGMQSNIQVRTLLLHYQRGNGENTFDETSSSVPPTDQPLV